MCIYMYRFLLRTCSRFKMSTPCVYIYTCICIHMHLHVHDIYRESVCVCVQYVCRDVCVCKHRSLFCTWSRFRMSKPCVYTYIYTCIYIYACIYMYMLYREGLYSMRVSVYVYRSLICTWSRFRMSKPCVYIFVYVYTCIYMYMIYRERVCVCVYSMYVGMCVCVSIGPCSAPGRGSECRSRSSRQRGRTWAPYAPASTKESTT